MIAPTNRRSITVSDVSIDWRSRLKVPLRGCATTARAAGQRPLRRVTCARPCAAGSHISPLHHLDRPRPRGPKPTRWDVAPGEHAVGMICIDPDRDGGPVVRHSKRLSSGSAGSPTKLCGPMPLPAAGDGPTPTEPITPEHQAEDVVPDRLRTRLERLRLRCRVFGVVGRPTAAGNRQATGVDLGRPNGTSGSTAGLGRGRW